MRRRGFIKTFTLGLPATLVAWDLIVPQPSTDVPVEELMKHPKCLLTHPVELDPKKGIDWSIYVETDAWFLS